MRQWQAILVGFGVLLIATETEVAPLAVIMAWSIALVYLVDTLSSSPGSVTKGLFGGTTS